MKVKSYKAPLSMGFSRQEYWSELTFPTPGNLPDLGIELASLNVSCLAGRFFTTSATWEAQELKVIVLYCVGVCIYIQKDSLKSLINISTERSHPLVLYQILTSWDEILKIFCFYVLTLYRNHDEEPPPGRKITVTSKQSYLKVKIGNDHIVNLSRDV